MILRSLGSAAVVVADAPLELGSCAVQPQSGRVDPRPDALEPPKVGKRACPQGPARYALDANGLLGSGSQADAHSATDKVTGRAVVIKKHFGGDAAPQIALMERFAKSTSPQLSKLLDAFTVAGVPHLVLEPAGTELLADRPSPDQAVAVVLTALGGLVALHEVGVVHLDINLRNILWTGRDPATVKLIDYDRSVALEADGLYRGRRNTLVQIHMPPEVFTEGPIISPASDIYEMGVLLFHLLCPSFMTFPAPRRIADEGLRAVVAKAVALEPAQRFASAQAMLDALLPYAPPGFALPPADPARQSLVERFRRGQSPA